MLGPTHSIKTVTKFKFFLFSTFKQRPRNFLKKMLNSGHNIKNMHVTVVKREGFSDKIEIWQLKMFAEL